MCHRIIAETICENCGLKLGERVIGFEACSRKCVNPAFRLSCEALEQLCPRCAAAAAAATKQEQEEERERQYQEEKQEFVTSPLADITVSTASTRASVDQGQLNVLSWPYEKHRHLVGALGCKQPSFNRIKVGRMGVDRSLLVSKQGNMRRRRPVWSEMDLLEES